MDNVETDYTEMDKIMKTVGCSGSNGQYSYNIGQPIDDVVSLDLSASSIEGILYRVYQVAKARGRGELQAEIREKLGF